MRKDLQSIEVYNTVDSICRSLLAVLLGFRVHSVGEGVCSLVVGAACQFVPLKVVTEASSSGCSCRSSLELLRLAACWVWERGHCSSRNSEKRFLWDPDSCVCVCVWGGGGGGEGY